MTAQIFRLCDYKAPFERTGEAFTTEMLDREVERLSLPPDFPIQYRRDDTAPSEMDSGDCA